MKETNILYKEVNGISSTRIREGETIVITTLERRYRNATPTTTSDIEKYPEGFEFDVTQEVKVAKDSYEEDLSDIGFDDTATKIVFEDGSEEYGHFLVRELNEQPQLVKNELDERLTIYEKYSKSVGENDE